MQLTWAPSLVPAATHARLAVTRHALSPIAPLLRRAASGDGSALPALATFASTAARAAAAGVANLEYPGDSRWLGGLVSGVRGQLLAGAELLELPGRVPADVLRAASYLESAQAGLDRALAWIALPAPASA